MYKYCKHCVEVHPLTEKYWYRNNGKLAKCKLYYAAYEAARRSVKPESRPYDTVLSDLCSRLSEAGFRPLKRYEANGSRIDVYLPDERICIKIKSDMRLSELQDDVARYEDAMPDCDVLTCIYSLESGHYSWDELVSAVVNLFAHHR